MSYRHRPFGITEGALRRELLRRRRAHRLGMAPLRHELARLKRRNRELRQYLTLLGAEIMGLEEQERELNRQLSTPAPNHVPPEADGPLGDQVRKLQQYRALQDHLITAVLSLIAPFLSSTPIGQHPKEERTWLTSPSESGSESAAP